MFTKKIIAGLFIVSLFLNIWFYFKWQQQETIIEDKLIEFSNQTVIGLSYFIQNDPNLLGEDNQKFLYYTLRKAENGAYYAGYLYHKNSNISIEDINLIKEFHNIIENKYLPVVEKAYFEGKVISENDERIIDNLGKNLKNAKFPVESIETVGWDKYINSVKEFINIEKNSKLMNN